MPLRLGLLTAAVLLVVPPAAQAGTVLWSIPTGDWSSSDNWGGTEPTSSDSAYIYNGGTATVTQAGEICQYLYLGDAGAGNSGTIQTTGGSIGMTAAYIGFNGTGAIAQSGGKISSASNGGFYLGYNSDAHGTFDLSGTGLLTIGSIHNANSEYVGYSGTGVFNQLGGTNTVNNAAQYIGYNSESSGTYNHSAGTNTIYKETSGSFISGLYLGYNSGASGTYELSGTGQLTAKYCSEYVGYSGTGVFIHSAGTNTIQSRSLYLGYNSGANGTYELSGTGRLSIIGTREEYVGYSGTGTFNHSAGTNTGTLCLGYNSGASGTYNLSGTGEHNGNTTVGYSGTGTFNHTGGTNTGNISLGNSSGGSGEYNLSGDGQIIAESESVGYSGTGIFNHTAGANTISSSLSLGKNAGASGTYNLSGTGQLSATLYEYIGYSGTGTFNHSAGTNSISRSLFLGHNSGASGTYELSGTGELNVTASSSDDRYGNVYVGYSGTGTFNHSAGTNSISNSLYVGHSSGSSGTYNLSGAGELSATNEYIDGKYIDGSGGAAVALFHQTGGVNTTNYIFIGKNGQYKFSGGNLLVGSLENMGTFDFDNSSAEFTAADGIINFARNGGVLKNTQAATLNIGSNALLIVAAGFNPAVEFAIFNNTGVLHTLGTPLTISSGKTISGWGTIEDPVDCQGTIAAAPGGAINLYNGLVISGTGSVDLGRGTLRNDDDTSGISGGSLSASSQFVGYNGNGAFTHSTGTNTLSLNLFIGCASGSEGTYNLSGTAQLSTHSIQYVGSSGSGTFNQSGGSNSTYGLYLGKSTNATGTYNLSDGELTVYDEDIGISGTGTFYQSGGTHTIGDLDLPGWGLWCLSIGSNSGSTGTYNLSDNGVLNASREYIGDNGTGTFNQSGGIHNVVSSLVLGANGAGTYYLTDGQLNAESEFLSTHGGTGVFIQSGGINTIHDTLCFGMGSGHGTYELNGGTLLLNSIEVKGATTVFRFGGGTLQANGDLSILDWRTGNPLAFPVTLTSDAKIDSAGYRMEFYGPFSGAGGLVKLGANTLALYGSNSYNGTTQIREGTLQVGKTASLPGYDTSGMVSVDADAMLAVNYGGSGEWTANSVNTLMSITSFADGALLGFDTTNAGGGATFGGEITLSGLGVEKLGAKTLILSGTNTYAGPTAVRAGTLQAARTDSLPGYDTPGTVSVDPDATLAVNYGGSGEWTAENVDVILDNVSFASGALLGFNTANADSGADYGSAIATGGLGVTKLGVNSLTFFAAHTYDGPTKIAVGTLALDVDASLASGVIEVCEDATFDVSAKIDGYHLLSGQTIIGNGTIIGDIIVDPGGDLAPGSSIGTLRCIGSLTLSGNASFELGTPGATHSSSGLSDRTNVPGDLVLGGTLTLLDNGGANGQGSAGAGAYKLLTWDGSQSGAFEAVVNPNAGLHAKTVVDGSDKAVYVELYRVAEAAPLPVYLGTIHVGQSFATQAIAVDNAAANDGYSEKLNAGISGLSGGATANGSFSLLAPRETDETSLMAGLGNSDTSVAGAKSGTVTLALASDGTGTSGYGTTDLTSQTVEVTGNVNLYAQPRFADAAGDAVLTMLDEQQYTLDFGDLTVDGGIKSSSFQLINLLLAEGYQDTLGGNFTTAGVTYFTLSKFANFSNVLPGNKKNNDLEVTFGPDQPLGIYSETLTLMPYWSNESGWGDLGEIQLTLIATVVPEPSTLAILISAAAGLLVYSLWRRRNSLASAA